MNIRMLKGTVLLIAAVLATACNKDGLKGDAYISFALSSDYSSYSISRLTEKLSSSGNDIVLPDTNDFILSITGSDGGQVYKGPYGDRPDPIPVQSGSYDVALYSMEFDGPAFSSPQFGDTRTVVVASGEVLAVKFGCTQLNCGMRLEFEDSFRDRFFSSDIFIRSGEHSLPYTYTEKRIAYFLPGILKVICSDGNDEMTILSRQLDAADILTIKLSASGENSGGFSVAVDTSRNWLYEDFTLGSGNDGSTAEKALAVADLIMNLGAKEVWVAGYIVGGDVTTSNINLEPPFSKNSHIAIADRTAVSERAECAAVELPSSGDIREAVNLVDHPDYIGRKLYVKGDIENYFGCPGVKNIKEFKLE